MRCKYAKPIALGSIIVATAMACRKNEEGASDPYEQGCGGMGTVIDADGHGYSVVHVGGRCWMAADLRTTHFRNGSPIPEVTDNSVWADLSTGAWCNYSNAPANDGIYGKLYNWYAVEDPAGLCPQGWHVPSDAEWKQLEVSLGLMVSESDLTGYRGEIQSVGGKLKAATLWYPPNIGATNASGFSGFPGGYRNLNGSFGNIGLYGYWWSASESGADTCWFRHLNYNNAGIGRNSNEKKLGLCVRCIRD